MHTTVYQYALHFCVWFYGCIKFVIIIWHIPPHTFNHVWCVFIIWCVNSRRTHVIYVWDGKCIHSVSIRLTFLCLVLWMYQICANHMTHTTTHIQSCILCIHHFMHKLENDTCNLCVRWKMHALCINTPFILVFGFMDVSNVRQSYDTYHHTHSIMYPMYSSFHA